MNIGSVEANFGTFVIIPPPTYTDPGDFRKRRSLKCMPWCAGKCPAIISRSSCKKSTGTIGNYYSPYRSMPKWNGAVVMKMHPVQSSKIDVICYDEQTHKLRVSFREEKLRDFCHVPEITFTAFLNARSKNRFFKRNIEDSFPCWASTTGNGKAICKPNLTRQRQTGPLILVLVVGCYF